LSKSKQNTIKIAITGPESTGKSSMAKALSEKLDCLWIPEYAREYLEKINRSYHYDDLFEIACGQKEREENGLKFSDRFLICDTDFLVLKIWSEHKYGKVHPFILEEYNKKSYDLTLLMNIDLPWQYDPQREHPDDRHYFFQWYQKELQNSNVKYGVVSGNNEERFIDAMRYIRATFHNP